MRSDCSPDCFGRDPRDARAADTRAADTRASDTRASDTRASDTRASDFGDDCRLSTLPRRSFEVLRASQFRSGAEDD